MLSIEFWLRTVKKSPQKLICLIFHLPKGQTHVHCLAGNEYHQAKDCKRKIQSPEEKEDANTACSSISRFFSDGVTNALNYIKSSGYLWHTCRFLLIRRDAYWFVRRRTAVVRLSRVCRSTFVLSRTHSSLHLVESYGIRTAVLRLSYPCVQHAYGILGKHVLPEESTRITATMTHFPIRTQSRA